MTLHSPAGSFLLARQTRYLVHFNLAWMLKKNELVRPDGKPGRE